ncbi:tetratricopeptide repeat protein [Onishia niordana]|uniref:tetratricopeptide repeat protein n=1 Tax=Onishia niordana TaxID=2508711 RepID=UPI001F10BE70|nr:sel1 repeat family protein [Halomonas niordiana]
MLVCLLMLSMPALGLDADAQAAKDEGMRLYNIQHSTAALPYLEQAADAGDVEAMYYMGEAERRQRMMSMTRAALDWYLKAAEHGEPYAMLRLFQGGACVAGDYCPEDAEGWREQALAETLPKAESGDTDAMLALYHIYRLLDDSGEGVEWLEKAAEAGNPEAQMRLGMNISGGQGWYFLESRRLEAAAEWFGKAAEQGYVPAIAQLSSVYVKLEEYGQAWSWMIEASNGGHVDKRLGEGWCYLDPGRDEKCQVEQDKIKGWAILAAMEEETGLRAAERVLDWNEDELSDRQMQEAEALAKEWMNKKPPLSNFPPRFGY